MSIRTTLLLLFPIVSLAGPPALAATPWVSGKDWELVFEDDFDGPSLNARNWSRIDYVNHNAPDWRKYQSQDESLVEFREQDGNSAMTLWENTETTPPRPIRPPQPRPMPAEECTL